MKELRPVNPVWLRPVKIQNTPIHEGFSYEEPAEEVTDELLLKTLISVRSKDGGIPMSTNFTEPNTIYNTKALPATATNLLKEKNFWTTVEGEKFIPDKLVKACIGLADGQEESVRNSSVFYAQRKLSIAKRWNIHNTTTWSKQKFQYWDELFVKILFTSIIIDAESDDYHHNHINHIIKVDVSQESLFAMKQKWEKALLRAIYKEDKPQYKAVKDKFQWHFKPKTFFETRINMSNY